MCKQNEYQLKLQSKQACHVIQQQHKNALAVYAGVSWIDKKTEINATAWVHVAYFNILLFCTKLKDSNYCKSFGISQSNSRHMTSLSSSIGKKKVI